LFRPSQFFRTMRTRSNATLSRNFGNKHRIIASILLALGGLMQFVWVATGKNFFAEVRHLDAVGGISIASMAFMASYFGFFVVNWLAARLTAWEAAYRGFRLPRRAVIRGLHYHSAHYFPVALLAFITVVGYQILLAMRVLNELSATKYLYVLCAEVI